MHAVAARRAPPSCARVLCGDVNVLNFGMLQRSLFVPRILTARVVELTMTNKWTWCAGREVDKFRNTTGSFKTKMRSGTRMPHARKQHATSLN